MTFFKLDDMKVDKNGKYKITVELPKQTSIIEIYPTIASMYKRNPLNCENPPDSEVPPNQNDNDIDNALNAN